MKKTMKRMIKADLELRMYRLEEALRDVELGYSENWGWAKAHLRLLCTIPGFWRKLPADLAEEAGYYRVVDGCYVETEKAVAEK